MNTNQTTQTARDTHRNAEKAREHDHNFPQALLLSFTAVDSYLDQGDQYGACEALCSAVLTLRQMASKSYTVEGHDFYLTTAHHVAQAAVECAEKYGVSTALPYSNLGKVQKQLGMTVEAIDSFQKAVEAQISNPHHTQNRPGVLANLKEILATAELMQGDDSALARAEEALATLKESDEEAFNKAVWLSHGHLRIAEALKERNREVARTHLEAARTIIRGDAEKFKLSISYLEKVESEFESAA